jgi:hypothetical protein
VPVGLEGNPPGTGGLGLPGKNVSVDSTTVRAGGSIAAFGNAANDNTDTTGKATSTRNDDVFGTIKT